MEKEIQSILQRLRAVKEELGDVESPEEQSNQPRREEDPFNYSQRVLFENIMEIKRTISQRDEESLICTNRRKVIELNAKIYKDLKGVINDYNDLQEHLIDEKHSGKGVHVSLERSFVEGKRKEEIMAILLSQIKLLQTKADENHATERIPL